MIQPLVSGRVKRYEVHARKEIATHMGGQEISDRVVLKESRVTSQLRKGLYVVQWILTMLPLP